MLAIKNVNYLKTIRYKSYIEIPDKPQSKIKFGLLEGFVPSLELEKKEEKHVYVKPKKTHHCESISVDEFLIGLENLKQKHIWWDSFNKD